MVTEAAYFSQEKLNRLNTVDKIHGIGDALVPDGLFRSGRTAKPRSRGDTDATRIPGFDNISAAPKSRSNSYEIHEPSSSEVARESYRCTAKTALMQTLPDRVQGYNTVPAPTNSRASGSRPASDARERKSFGSPPPSRGHHRDGTASNSPSPSCKSSSGQTLASRTPSPSLVRSKKLVPLEYLQNVTLARRDPADEQLLRRFNSQPASPAGASLANHGLSYFPAGIGHDQFVARHATAGIR